MKYLLIEPATTSIAYNIALMKWARWCEMHGYEYEYVRGIVEPNIIPDHMVMSCIFTFYWKKYVKTINHYLEKFPKSDLTVGGVTASIHPEWFYQEWGKPNLFMNGIGGRVNVHKGTHPEIEPLVPKWNVDVHDEDFYKSERIKNRALNKKKKIVMYASRGCVNKCGYCMVPKIEGDMKSFESIKEYLEVSKKELPDASSIVLYDNNFTEHTFIHNIIDELINHGMPVDIHGLHVDSFTDDIAKHMSQLKFASQNEGATAYTRFSFDKMKYRDNIFRALKLSEKHKIGASFFCYMLFNFVDSPFDFWKRLVLSQEMTEEVGRNIYLFPQRYEPFDSKDKYKYIGKKWTQEQAAGVKRMATFLHGFLPTTKTRNVFNWVGHNYEEFINNAERMGITTKQRLIKKEGSPPSLKELLETIN